MTPMPHLPLFFSGIVARLLSRHSALRLARGFSGKWYSPPGEALHRRLFHRVQKVGSIVCKTKCVNGTKVIVIAKRADLPASIAGESVSPHEIIFVERTLYGGLVNEVIPKVIEYFPYYSVNFAVALGKCNFRGFFLQRNGRNQYRMKVGQRLNRYEQYFKAESFFFVDSKLSEISSEV